MRHLSKTTAVIAIQECVAYSRMMGKASAVYGVAGIGKTATLTWIAENDPSATLIHVGSTRCSPRAVATLIADAMHLFVNHQSAWQITDIIESHLQHPSARNEIFMFDEAQNIPLAFLKDIVDWPSRFGVPVLICGNEHFLKRTRATGAAFDQIDSRISKRVQLYKPTREDFETIAIDFDVFGTDARNACAAFGANTEIRRLIDLLEAAQQIAEGGKIGLEEIRKAVILKENHNALKLLSRQAA